MSAGRIPTYRRRRRRYVPPKPAAGTLLKMLEKLGLTDQVRRLRIARAWNEAVGKGIAARTQPLGFSRGVLLVKSNSAAWQNELTFLKADIITKVNAALGRQMVKELKVVAGRIEPVTEPRPKPAWVSDKPSADDLDVARDASQPLADPELREAFESLLLVDRRAHRARGK